MHWASKYIGRKCDDKNDCFQWFRTISKEQFGVDVADFKIDPCRRVRSAARIMADDIKEVFGWVETDSPKEGDAVFMSQKARPHHLGMAVYIGGQMRVLHALDGSGILCTDLSGLRANGWKITGYFTNAA